MDCEYTVPQWPEVGTNKSYLLYYVHLSKTFTPMHLNKIIVLL